ncbi:hypothetical protein TorRG33x02_032510, partial [Trema orientale]
TFYCYRHFLAQVDDVIVTCNDSEFLAPFIHALYINKLDSMISTTLLVFHTPIGLLPTQHRYIRDLLVKAKMIEEKEVITRFLARTLVIFDGSSSTNAT